MVGYDCKNELNPPAACYGRSLKNFVLTSLENGIKLGDGASNGQCVGVIREWYKYLYGIYPGAGNACQLFSPAVFPEIIANGGTLISNSPTNYPSVGDIIVYDCDSQGSGGFGHVAVVICADVNNVWALQQNGVANGFTGTAPYEGLLNYNDCLGWIHLDDDDVCDRGVDITEEPIDPLCIHTGYIRTGRYKDVEGLRYYELLSNCGFYTYEAVGEPIPVPPLPEPTPDCEVQINFTPLSC